MMDLTLATGMLLLLSSFMVAIREILLRPGNDQYPRAPFIVLSAMFAYGLVLFLLGWNLIFNAIDHGPPMAPPGIFVLALVITFKSAVFLGNLFTMRRKAETWARIRRIARMGKCDNAFRKARERAAAASGTVPMATGLVASAALVELDGRGVHVAAPNEPPSLDFLVG